MLLKEATSSHLTVFSPMIKKVRQPYVGEFVLSFDFNYVQSTPANRYSRNQNQSVFVSGSKPILYLLGFFPKIVDISSIILSDG